MRWWLVGGAVLVVALFAVSGPGADEPTGPRGSSYAVGEEGTAAFAELLERAGHDVRRMRRTLTDASLAPADVVVLLDPRRLDRTDRAALRAFLDAGGRLVASGRSGADVVASMIAEQPALGEGEPSRGGALAPVPEVAGVAEVQAAGTRRWTEAGSLVPALSDTAGVLVLVGDPGGGRAVLLAEPTVLFNNRLGDGDNALLALNLVGPPAGRVYFVEYVHGFAARRGLGALPVEWRWTLSGLMLAGLVWMASKARRLGPPEQVAAGAATPPRVRYVDAVATTLRRTKQPAEALAPVGREARLRLARRAGLSPAATDAELADAAVLFGLDPGVVAAVLDPAESDEGIVAAGTALTRLV